MIHSIAQKYEEINYEYYPHTLRVRVVTFYGKDGDEMLKLTRKQSAKVRKLARRECCNCVDGNCLLLDDGEPCRCVQANSLYGIYCKYFLTAVLPAYKELYEKILQQNNH